MEHRIKLKNWKCISYDEYFHIELVNLKFKKFMLNRVSRVYSSRYIEYIRNVYEYILHRLKRYKKQSFWKGSTMQIFVERDVSRFFISKKSKFYNSSLISNHSIN